MENKETDKKLADSDRNPKNHTNRVSILKITVAGVFAALILLATQLKIPTGIGYVNLGDGFILIASYLLGPAAFFPAAIGSGLADLLAGYPNYIAATFVIKGMMGFVAGLLLKNEKVRISRRILAFTIAEIIMIGGYFLFESLPFMYGPAAAAGEMLANAGQGVVGILAGILLTLALDKQRTSIRNKLNG